MLTVEDLRNSARKSGFDYVAAWFRADGAPRGFAGQVPPTFSHLGAQFQFKKRDTALEAAQDVIDYINKKPITIEDIRNPKLRSGFDHVNTAGPGGKANGGGGRIKWFAVVRPGRKGASDAEYRGPRRSMPEEAAQDYCDYINGQNATPAPRLKTAGHKYDIEQTDRDPEVEAALGVLRDARAQREGVQGYVYCIGEETDDPEFVKVGYSVNPNKRVAELQTGNPRKLVILAIMEGTLEDERRLHAKYSDANILQEWFELSDELLEEFDTPADEVAGETEEVTAA